MSGKLSGYELFWKTSWYDQTPRAGLFGGLGESQTALESVVVRLDGMVFGLNWLHWSSMATAPRQSASCAVAAPLK